MNKNKWIRHEKKNTISNEVPGVYACNTTKHRKIYCYAKNATSSVPILINGLRDDESILSIGKEHI